MMARKGQYLYGKVGNVGLHPIYGEFTVVERLHAKIKVRFAATGYERYVGCTDFKNLKFRDPMQRVKVLGVGINDATYRLQEKVTIGYTIDNRPIQRKVWTCPFYEKWYGMLKRVYCEKQLIKDHQYVGCHVCEEWLTFSKFKAWMESQDWEGGKHLDKDLLGGGKEYSPECCAFILQKTNKFMTDRKNHRGEFMIGVSRQKPTHRFSANINDGSGNSFHLGRYTTELEAHKAWQTKKHEQACLLAEQESDLRVADALRQRYAPDKDWSKS